MKRERLIWIIFAVCAVTAIVLLNIFSPTEPADLSVEDVKASECETLMPVEIALISNEKQHEKYFDLRQSLDFSKKENLGQGRYGFRKTLEVEETTILEQELWSSNKSMFYGIYEDPNLTKTLGRASIEESYKIHNALELGASLEDYPDDQSNVVTVLEPGTYYIAVYTTDESDAEVEYYESKMAVVKTELPLNEGEWGYFFSTGKEQKTYFRIEVDHAATLAVEKNFSAFTYDLWLCDKSKEPISLAEVPPKEKGKRQKAIVEIPEAGTYYLQVSTIDDSPSCWSREIRYREI